MQQYLNLLKDIKENGVRKPNRTGVDTFSVTGRMVKFNLQEGFPLLTTKKLHTKSIKHELLWFLNGETNVKYLQDNGVRIWNEWADENGELGKIYGYQWRHWEKKNGEVIDQVSEIIQKLKNKPEDRRMIVNAWNVGELNEMNLPPCHLMWQVFSQPLEEKDRLKKFLDWVKNNSIDITRIPVEEAMNQYNFPKRRLDLVWYQRSVDTFLGLPFNIASYALLIHMLANVTNHEVGELTGMLGDVHLYENHIHYVIEQIKRKPTKLPQLKINQNVDSIFDYKYEDLKFINYSAQPNWKKPPIAK